MACLSVFADGSLFDAAVAVTGHVELPETPAAAPMAREFVRGYLDGVPPQICADVLLLTSELVTNVLLHARTRVHLGVTRDADNVFVCVQDHSERTTYERADKTPDALRETRRAMAIIASLADDFGWKRLPNEVGKVMWFVMGAKEHPTMLQLELDPEWPVRLI